MAGMGTQKPAGGLVLAAGGMATKLGAIADAVGRANLGFPLLLASGTGVVTERGEIEGESAAAILLWLGGSAEAWVVSASQADLCLTLSRELRARNEAGRAETSLVFLRPNGVQPHSIEALHGLKGSRVLGAGTLPDSDVYAVDSSGSVSSGAAGALTVRGLPAPIVGTSPACK